MKKEAISTPPHWHNTRLQRRLKLQSSVMGSVSALLAAIDGVKNSRQMREKLMPPSKERFIREAIMASTESSSRMAGNQLHDLECEKFFRKGDPKKFISAGEEEAVGYLRCLELSMHHYEDLPIHESTIFKLHHDLFAYSDKELHHKGVYRSSSIRVEAKDQAGKFMTVLFEPTQPYLVKKEMQELLAWYQWAISAKEHHPLVVTANFIFEYLAIHPFQDGNGRTSRLLTNLILQQHGYPFAQVASHEHCLEIHKTEYDSALQKTQKTWKTPSEDIAPWLLFFLNSIKIQSQQALQRIEENNIDHQLSEKQVTLWHWAKSQGTDFRGSEGIKASAPLEQKKKSIFKKFLGLRHPKK